MTEQILCMFAIWATVSIPAFIVLRKHLRARDDASRKFTESTPGISRPSRGGGRVSDPSDPATTVSHSFHEADNGR